MHDGMPRAGPTLVGPPPNRLPGPWRTVAQIRPRYRDVGAWPDLSTIEAESGQAFRTVGGIATTLNTPDVDREKP